MRPTYGDKTGARDCRVATTAKLSSARERHSPQLQGAAVRRVECLSILRRACTILLWPSTTAASNSQCGYA